MLIGFQHLSIVKNFPVNVSAKGVILGEAIPVIKATTNSEVDVGIAWVEVEGVPSRREIVSEKDFKKSLTEVMGFKMEGVIANLEELIGTQGGKEGYR
ncbi:hypothetical protein Tco_1084956 [Tanacetum coccineum]